MNAEVEKMVDEMVNVVCSLEGSVPYRDPSTEAETDSSERQITSSNNQAKIDVHKLISRMATYSPRGKTQLDDTLLIKEGMSNKELYQMYMNVTSSGLDKVQLFSNLKARLLNKAAPAEASNEPETPDEQNEKAATNGEESSLPLSNSHMNIMGTKDFRRKPFRSRKSHAPQMHAQEEDTTDDMIKKTPQDEFVALKQEAAKYGAKLSIVNRDTYKNMYSGGVVGSTAGEIPQTLFALETNDSDGESHKQESDTVPNSNDDDSSVLQTKSETDITKDELTKRYNLQLLLSKQISAVQQQQQAASAAEYRCDICQTRFKDAGTMQKHRALCFFLQRTFTTLSRTPNPAAVANMNFNGNNQNQFNNSIGNNNQINYAGLNQMSYLKTLAAASAASSNPVPDATNEEGPVDYSTKGSSNGVDSNSKSDKKFECNICHKRFVDKFYLTYHMRIHTGEKPFSCKYCSELFRWKSTLKIHMAQQHPDKDQSIEESSPAASATSTVGGQSSSPPTIPGVNNRATPMQSSFVPVDMMNSKTLTRTLQDSRMSRPIPIIPKPKGWISEVLC